MIPNNVCKKYGLESLEDLTNILRTETEEQINQVNTNFYQSFLNATDYEMTKAFETLFSEPSKFVTNIITLYKKYADIIQYRVEARTYLEEHGK